MKVKDIPALHMDLNDAAASSKYKREAGEQADSAAQYARQAQGSAQRADSLAAAAAEAAGHYPRVSGGFWQVWDAERREYVSTGVKAQGEPGPTGPQGARGPGVNENLLANWYFVGGGSQGTPCAFPINQRGQTHYTGAVYSIDLWRGGGTNAANLVVDVLGDALQVSSMTASNYNWIRQVFDRPMPAGTYTASVLVKRATIDATCRIAFFKHLTRVASTIITGPGLYSCTFAAPEAGAFNGVAVSVGVRCALDIAAVKLEPGDTQTLAHEENGEWVLNELPEFGEELLACQRYFQTFRTSALRPAFGADCRPVMSPVDPTKETPELKPEPTQGTVVVGGVTYYTLEI